QYRGMMMAETVGRDVPDRPQCAVRDVRRYLGSRNCSMTAETVGRDVPDRPQCDVRDLRR
ncbi:MAG: hypothetical protein PHR35_20495, partial [Kiritimatiellae bacterium]|nr:hypothetical protein [Kiritimatiellia bacterium]